MFFVWAKVAVEDIGLEEPPSPSLEHALDGPEGTGRVVTTFVTFFEKNFSSRWEALVVNPNRLARGNIAHRS